jgi:hypothetical protein
VLQPVGRAETSRRTLSRERVVTEVLAVISTEGAQALSMAPLLAASARFPVRCIVTSAARNSRSTVILSGGRGSVGNR